jgi:hypothetical protein
VVVPVSRSGVALFGDADKFVPDGRKRIAALEDAPQRLTATVLFAPGEDSVRLFGYAPRPPAVKAQEGSSGEVSFDGKTGRFEVRVSPGPAPGPAPAASGPSEDPVRRAIVSFEE